MLRQYPRHTGSMLSLYRAAFGPLPFETHPPVAAQAMGTRCSFVCVFATTKVAHVWACISV